MPVPVAVVVATKIVPTVFELAPTVVKSDVPTVRIAYRWPYTKLVALIIVDLFCYEKPTEFNASADTLNDDISYGLVSYGNRPYGV